MSCNSVALSAIFYEENQDSNPPLSVCVCVGITKHYNYTNRLLQLQQLLTAMAHLFC